MLKHILLNIKSSKNINHLVAYHYVNVFKFYQYEDIINYISINNISEKELIIISDSIEIISQILNHNFCIIGYEHDDIHFAKLNINLILDIDCVSYSYLDSVLSHHYNLPWILFENKELIIVEPSTYDFPTIYQMYSCDSNSKNTYLHNYMNLEYESEKERFNSYINTQFKFYGYGIYNITFKENKVIIGQCGLYNDTNGNLCISYYVKPDYRKNNVAYICCNAVIEYAKKELCARKIHAHIYEDNLPSICLANKLGFIKEAPDLYVLYM